MPIPKTQDPGKTIKFLKKEKPGMPHKQKVAVALETARKSGASIPRRRKKRRDKTKTGVASEAIRQETS